MSDVSITTPEDALTAAMKLFELGQLSSGAAEKLAGVSRVEFLERFAEFGIDTFRLTREDLESEARLG